MAAPVDRVEIGRASEQFTRATARFIAGLRAAGSTLRFPEQPQRYNSAVGLVSIGTRGSDRHGSDAALIIDPGGDDIYERAPVTDARVSLVFDLGGNDRYVGADLVVNGLAALVDFSGDDRYEASGPGLGAAVAGVSLLVDFSGNDTYEAQFSDKAPLRSGSEHCSITRAMTATNCALRDRASESAAVWVCCGIGPETIATAPVV